jgi:hypothetical protein
VKLPSRRTSKDPLVRSLLDTHKFNLLSVPRQNSHIFDLYISKGGGILPPSNLRSLYSAVPNLPKPIENEKFEAPEKTFSSELELGIVERLTGSLFSAQGAALADGKLSSELKLKGANRARIRFHEVTRDSVDPVKVHRAIAGNSVAPESYEFIAGSHLYLVIGVIRAKGLEIEASTERQQTVAVDVALDAVVKTKGEAQGRMEVGRSQSGGLVFKGRDRIAFGVEVVELKLNKDFHSLGVGKMPPALDIRTDIAAEPLLLGDLSSSILVDLPAP